MSKSWFAGVRVAALVGFAAALPACYPGEVTNLSQLDVVVTLHADTVDFTQFNSIAIIDSIIHLRDPDDPSDTVPISRDFDDLIVETTVNNYSAFGWNVVLVPADQTEFPPDSTPDFVTFLGVTASSNYFAYVTYPWWGYWGWWGGWGWWPGYGPGWGWGWPCCGSVNTGSYATGTVILYQFDPNTPVPADSLLNAIWTGALNGVISGSQSGTASRISNGINQMFSQSQYLKVN
jgi:hypothetical protein